MKDNILGFESLNWILSDSEYGFFIVTASSRMQREIAGRYDYSNILVYDYSREEKPYSYSKLALAIENAPDKRAYFLLNFQLAIPQEEDVENFNFSRDMLAREKKNIVLFMTEDAQRRLNRGALDFISYVRLTLPFEDELPDKELLIGELNMPFDMSEGVEQPQIDFSESKAALLAKAIAFTNRAESYYDAARYSDALTLLNAALKIRLKLLDAEHPDTAGTYNNTAGLYQAMGEYKLALEYYKKALEIFEKVLGKEHPDTAGTYNNIAGLYQAMGEHEQALNYCKKALEIYEKVLGKEHPDTAATYNNIAVLYQHMGDYKRALAYSEKALAIREKVLGKEHPNTATTYNNIAVLYHDMGETKQALAYYEKALAIREKVHGKEHPDTAMTYNNIAVLYHDMGETKQALAYYEKALAIMEKTLGKEHPSIATVKNNMNKLLSEKQ
ncbi:MAG: tetratricopeptide repeat protein [Clostridia bacterium]|nr:tetratricopeptide repeat protein [Clostridia bacterium]